MQPPPRQLTPELMDDPGLAPAEHLRALRGLARLNRWSRGPAALWPTIRPLLRAERPLRVLDIATGSADIPIALACRARRAGFAMEIDGCDVSPTALAAARTAADAQAITFRAHLLDATTRDLPAGADIATCSLFMHHLDDDAAIAVLRRMAAAAPVVLISDLRRCRRGIALAYIASRMLASSPIVHADAVLSARAAYTAQELLALSLRAGLAGATIRRAWPFRMLLRWNAPR